MQGSHLELINVEGQVGVGLEQPLCVLVSGFNHSKELFAVVVVE